MSYNQNNPPHTGPINLSDYLAHRAWICGEPGGRRLDLTNVELDGGTINNVNLRGAIFRYAQFIDVTIINTIFEGAQLGGSRFTNTDLDSVTFHCNDMEDSTFQDSTLTNVQFSRCNLYASAFWRTTLTNVTFSATNFSYCDLSSVTFTSDMNGAFSATNFEGTKLPDGWYWWQGGASGPRRRMMRVWKFGADAPIMAHQGCIHGTVKEVRAGLKARAKQWASEYGETLANLWLTESLGMLRIGEIHVRNRAALEVAQ